MRNKHLLLHLFLIHALAVLHQIKLVQSHPILLRNQRHVKKNEGDFLLKRLSSSISTIRQTQCRCLFSIRGGANMDTSEKKKTKFLFSFWKNRGIKKRGNIRKAHNKDYFQSSKQQSNNLAEKDNDGDDNKTLSSHDIIATTSNTQTLNTSSLFIGSSEKDDIMVTKKTPNDSAIIGRNKKLTTKHDKSAPPPGFPIINHVAPNRNNEGSITLLSSLPIMLINNLKKYVNKERLWTLTQYGVGFWLFMALCKEIREAWDEVVEEAEEKSRGPGFGVKEEHDLPFLSADSIDLFLLDEYEKRRHEKLLSEMELLEQQLKSGETLSTDKAAIKESTEQYPKLNKTKSSNFSSSSTSKKNAAAMKRIRRESFYAKDLALRLHATGLPLIEEEAIHANDDHDRNHDTNTATTHNLNNKKVGLTVGSVLKSLTKAEGQLLSNTLLLPPERHQGQERDKEYSNVKDPFGQIGFSAWNDIGGLDHVKEALLDLMYPLMNDSNLFYNSENTETNHNNYYGGLLNHPPGLLLYGPPGCGKTLLARALAQSTNARFLCVTPSTLLRKYVGETNLNVRALFSLARKIQPCVIFVDEMDGLFRERGGGVLGGGDGEEHTVSRDLKTEFMQLWDGIASPAQSSISNPSLLHENARSGNDVTSNSNGVIVIGATNRPFDVDSAFLRRMPRSFYVGLPDFSSRCAILQTMLRDVPLSTDFDIGTIAQQTEGYSGSDLKELLRSAALFPLREARLKLMQNRNSKNDKNIGMPQLRSLTTADVLKAKERIVPTQFSPGYRAALAEYTQRAHSSIENNDGDHSYVDGYYNHDVAGNHQNSNNGQSSNIYDDKDFRTYGYSDNIDTDNSDDFSSSFEDTDDDLL